MSDHGTWVLVWLRTGGDYYVGEQAALYRNGRKVWEDVSADAAEGLAAAILGADLSVREVDDLPIQGEGGRFFYFPDDLADLDN